MLIDQFVSAMHEIYRVCSQGFRIICLFRTVISPFVFCGIAVFDRRIRTAADTRHTMCAVPVPDRFSVFTACEIVHRAVSQTLSASAASCRIHTEFSVFDDRSEKSIVDDRTADSRKELRAASAKHFARLDVLRNAVYDRNGFLHDFTRFFF